MGKNTDKFLLLIWKNFLLQWRHRIQTIVELLAPILIASLLVVIRSLVGPSDYAGRVYTPFTIAAPSMRTAKLVWSPLHPDLNQIMNDTATALNETMSSTNFTITEFRGLADSKALEAFLKREINDENSTWGDYQMIAGIQFDDALLGMDTLPPTVNVVIRMPAELDKYFNWENWETASLFPMFQQNGPRSADRNNGGPPDYIKSGFLALQQEVSFSLINYFKNSTQNIPFNREDVPIYMQRFPYPKWVEDLMLTMLESLLSQMIMISFIYTCMTTVKAITTEKEKQLKEIMKIMGLPGWLHWTAWFLKTFVLLIVPMIFIVILYSVRWSSGLAIFTHSNPFIVFLFLVFYACAATTFCFALSSLFSKANIASVISAIVWYISFLPFGFTQTSYDTLSLGAKLSASLLPNSAMGYGFQLMLMFESNEEGIQFHNLWTTASPDDQLVLGQLLIMLAADAVLYLLIALYVEAVFPGEYGVPLPWYFPFTPSYWVGKPQNIESEQLFEETTENKFYEKEPTHLQTGVKIQNLRKQFSKKNVAVKNLSLNLFQDQITVLLGHNGAGKTTTMSMLTGMIPPSSGTALVGGHDIRTDIAGVRDSLGLCPQHNILFDELTVKEHLYFFSRLKGLEKEEINREIDKFIGLLEFADKGEALSSTLSGGMKRKLSVAIALTGDSSVVMCDEPSSGMDPSARRALWDLLQSQKKGRTILLTTHFMDEADLLGDRIAIMAGGELQCCGSSYFLKKKYGAGYRLIMDKSPLCEISQVTGLLQKYIPDIKVETNIGSELTYILNEEKSSVFEEMLKEVESHSTNLGVLSYGISITNFDEVFMKVSAGHNQDNMKENGSEVNGTGDVFSNRHVDGIYGEIKVDVNEQRSHYLTGWSLWCNQFLAMLMKKGLSTLRSWIVFFIQICIAIVPLIMILVLITTLGVLKDLPNLKIELDSYNHPVTVLTHDNNEYAQAYMDNLNAHDKTLIDWKDENMTTKMIEETLQNAGSVRTSYISGASFWPNQSITAWFSNNPYHAMPVSLQLVMNAILQKEVSPDYSLQIYNHPLPFPDSTKENLESQEVSIVGIGFQLALTLGFSMAFISPTYIMFYVRERVSKAKHLQFVSGAEIIPFWLSAFICDLLMYLVLSVGIIITIAVFQIEGLSTGAELGRAFSVLFCFGFSALPLNYLASHRFESPASGYIKMVLFNTIAGQVVFLLLHFCEPILDEYSAYNPLHFIFLFVPLYSFCTGIRNINDLYSIRKECNEVIENCINLPAIIFKTPEECNAEMCITYRRCCNVKDYYDMAEPGIGANVFISCLVGAIWIAVLLGIEYHWFEIIYYKTFYKKRPPVQQQTAQEDMDVSYEKEKIRKAVDMQEINKYNLLMSNVTKYYNNFLAVNNISLGVNQYECFGLLGVNGAGKTTTFKMMTGDITFSYGDAWVNGLNLKTDLKQIYRLIGYCPQFDALLDDLTCRETIIIFGLLRGITMKESKLMAEKLAGEFDFGQHLDKYVKQLSGGNKRKLSTAIALIGDPLVIYLDEPTTGMDPATKRYLWNELCKIRDRGKCIVLTSHSMEECEALCTRLAIMVNGGFMCLGSTQHLKSKFSEGYTLIVRLRRNAEEGVPQSSEAEPIEAFVKEHFPGAVVREKHQELITFYIADKTQPWSKMFGIMEKGKRSLNIEDYSLGQSSLEQVFLSFTKYQQITSNH